MNKTAQCIIKAAQLRAQADKLEKVAFTLVDVGALSLLGSASAYGVHQFMKNRAAAKAAAKAAAEAAAAMAAPKSQLRDKILRYSGINYGMEKAKSLMDAARQSRAGDLSGYLAGGAVGGLSGYLAGSALGHLAGDPAGDLAGDPAGGVPII